MAVFADNETWLTFDDVLLLPQHSDIDSRSTIDLSGGKLELKTPIISANMDTVTEEDMAIAMHNAGGLGIIHRFLDEKRLQQIISRCKSAGATPAISVGINHKDIDLLLCAVHMGVRIYCVDVAHGDHSGVLEQIEFIREVANSLKINPLIIAGNVVTPDAVARLAQAGADIVKVGIGGGHACSTRVVTGHGAPQITALIKCAEEASKHNVEIIADGGIRNSGDIAKCIAAGARYVMIGKLFSATKEAPGERITENIKRYRGMASKEAQRTIGKKRLPEGVSGLVSISGTAGELVGDLSDGLRSALSYTAATNIDEFQSKAKFIRITSAGNIEGQPRL